MYFYRIVLTLFQPLLGISLTTRPPKQELGDVELRYQCERDEAEAKVS